MSQGLLSKWSLEATLKVHSGDKSYPFNQCPQTFSESCNLEKHLRIHSGEKPYPCIQCPKAFSEWVV